MKPIKIGNKIWFEIDISAPIRKIYVIAIQLNLFVILWSS